MSHTLDESEEMRNDRKRLEQLPVGKVILHAPIAMTVGDRRVVNARVGVEVPDDVLKSYARIGNQTAEGPLRVSHHMIATLNGAGFDIKRTTPEEQTVAEGFPTAWAWEIEARTAGAQELEATLYVLLADTSGAPTRHWIASYVEKIDVSVKAQTWSEWVKSVSEQVNALEAIAIAIGSILTAAFGWLGISLTRKRKQTRVTRRKSTVKPSTLAARHS